MLYLITGASGSGKSEYAEDVACYLARRDGMRHKLYVATMEAKSEEAQERIARHKRQRQGKGFVTVESLYGLAFSFPGEEKAPFRLPCLPQDCVILLECLSNLLANLMFSDKRSGGQATEANLSQVRQRQRLCRHLVIVTNEVFSDGMLYTGEVLEYVRALGTLNRLLAEEADGFLEVVYSVPLWLKGDRIWQF